MILIYTFPTEVLTVATEESIPAQSELRAPNIVAAQPEPMAQNIVTAEPEPVVPSVVPIQTIPAGKNIIEYNVLGYSSMGTMIHDVVIAPATYDRTMLITFAVHGFDGAWKKDGAALVQIANDVIREFSNHPEELNTTRLIIVPCVNPDGILYGQSENGIGRCNGQGIDINRDFDYYWEYSSNSKYHTGKAPFSTPEAQILSKLVLNEKPDIVIDFHGWSNCTYGDVELSDYFNKAFGMNNLNPKSNDMNYLQQHFVGWASQFARTVLVEYPNPENPQNLIERLYSNKTISAIKEIFSKP